MSSKYEQEKRDKLQGLKDNFKDKHTPRMDQSRPRFEHAKFIEEYNPHKDISRKYAKGKYLGKGGFAKCYEFTVMETNEVVASKVIPKNTLTKSRAMQKLKSEIKIHKSLSHTGVVKFKHYFEDTENVYILLELCTNQTMNELVRRRKKLSEIEVQCYMVQILKAVKYLHQNRVIHRDLKLGNLFISDGMEIKLGDFGLATKLDYDGERKKTICGTPNYIAPEILEGNKRGHSYEVDIWSIGVILYALLFGKPPFETNDVKTTYKRIKSNLYTFPEHTSVSDAAKDLIRKILQTDPAKRPIIDEILSHQFFNNGVNIPRVLPRSTLACPLTPQQLTQYMQKSSKSGVLKDDTISPRKLESTAPLHKNQQITLKERKDFVNTDRMNLFMGQSSKQYDANNVNNQNISKKQMELSDKYSNYLKSQKNIQHTQGQENINTNMTNSVRNSVDKYSSYNNNKVITKNLNTMTEANLNTKQAIVGQFAQPSSTANLNTQINTLVGNTSNIWVEKWVDYSSKYGLGYLMSSGSAGAYFNDNTKLILDKQGDKLEYIERKGKEEREDISVFYSMSDFPKELNKKVTLLGHFKAFLMGEKQKKSDQIPLSTENDQQQQQQQGQNENKDNNKQNSDQNNEKQIYVKKWFKTKHAIMFRLSNKVVQVVFQDETQIILSSQQRIVTYLNKKKERQTFPLANALESDNTEMTKRLKYTKDILNHMLGTNQNNNQNKDSQQQQQQQQSNNNSQIKNNMISSKQLSYERGSSLTRTNKHFASNYGSHDKKAVTSQQNNLNKYASSVDNKPNYAFSNVNSFSNTNLSKNLKSNLSKFNDENEMLQSQVSSRLQKLQSSQNCYNQNVLASTYNSSKSTVGFNQGQILKSQSTIGRKSLINTQSNNYMYESIQANKKTEYQ